MVKGVIELSFVCVPCRERPSVEVMEVYLRDDSISESESDNESVPVFDTLVDLASEHVMPLMEYVRRTWLESDVWPVHSWSVYGRSVRTNNDVEGKYTFIISLLMIKFNTLENYSRS